MKIENLKIWIAVLSCSLIGNLYAGELNFAGLFEGLSGTPVQEQRQLEEKIETNLRSFRSVASAKVVIPGNELSRVESLWGMSEAKVLSVEVILKLKKRKRLTQNEFRGIGNLISSSLSEKNVMVQSVIRDEEGFEWTEESSEAKSYFKVTALENEIWGVLKANWSKEVQWTQVNVSEKDNSCKVDGVLESPGAEPNLKLRRDVMNLVGDLCPSARLALVPKVSASSFLASEEDLFPWLERAAYTLLGFAIWGLCFAIGRKRTSPVLKRTDEDEGAIILTKIVDRSPDQAAKWMVKAMLSDAKSEESDKSPKPQIFDQTP